MDATTPKEYSMTEEREDPQPDHGRDDEAHDKEKGEGLGPPEEAEHLPAAAEAEDEAEEEG